MGIEKIVVRRVCVEKLIAFFDVQLQENERLYFDDVAVWNDTFWISTDCTFSSVVDRHYDSKIHKVIDVECRVNKYKEDGSYSMRMDKPDFVKAISLEDFKSVSDEWFLKDFIRFNYNSRIISNQKLFMEYVREVVTESEQLK